MDPENISIEDALPQVTPDPIVGANPSNLPQQPPSNGPLPVPTPSGGFVSPETPASKKNFFKSKTFLILIALIILVLIAAIAFYFIKIAPVNKSQPSSSAENQFQNYSQSNNLENQNAVLNPNQVIPANVSAEGKLLIRSKNGDFIAKDIASGQDILISKSDLKAGPGRGTGDSISPNGQFIYYQITDAKNNPTTFIFDFKTQKNYQVNNLDPSLLNAKWSEDSKAILVYSLNSTTITKAQLIAVDDSSLSNLTPKDLNIPQSINSQLEITKFPNNNELWYATSDQNEQFKQIYNQTYSQGKVPSEQDIKSLTSNLVIHVVLLKLNLQSQKEDKILEMNISMNEDKLKEMNHCSGKFESIVDKLLYICSKQEQGKLKLYFLDPRDFSVTNEVEMQANVNENSTILFRNPKALNKVIIETENTLNQGTGEEQTLYFRQMPNLAELPNELPVKLQEISPNFSNKGVDIEAVSPYGVFMVFSVQENCQPQIACDQNHYLYDFRNRTSKLIYSDKAGDLNIDVKQVILTGY